MTPPHLTARGRARLGRLSRLAREHTKIERELNRSLARASAAGYSLRVLQAATGIPRVTLARRIESSNGGAP